MRHWKPVVLSLLLFALNAYICRELFSIEFMRNLDTNDACFVALSRFFREHPTDFRWFPWFNTGMPIENAYQPLLPILAAVTGALSGWSVERAFHCVLAFAYCAGPVALFWFAWDWSGSLVLSGIAGFTWSLTSFGTWLIPILRVDRDGHWAPLRLYNLIHYAEDPHTLALSILPLALLVLRRAMLRRSPKNFAGAMLACAAVVLTNVFGGVDLAIGGICIALAADSGIGGLALVGTASWLLISPWLPPSLVNHIRQDQGVHSYAANIVVLLGVALAWFASRQLRGSLDRFTLLFALWISIIPLSFFWWGITLVPQGNRYQLELEMALSLAFACLCTRLPWKPVVIAVLILIGVRQAIVFRRAGRTLIQPVDIASTIEYKVSTWIDRNLPNRRTMLAGDPQFLFNVLSNNPQMSASHDPTAPNWMQRVAVYTIYTGDGAGAHDAEDSIFWLKAFGNHAIYVPGPNSREFYHRVVHPHKFDGILPVLWHEEDDTIYAVPQRSPSLAHVIPKSAVVVRTPVNGLDLEPARAYVKALDDPALPLASVTWTSPSHATIRAQMAPGQVISLQETYAPGWYAPHAVVTADALGLITIDPECKGPCQIELSFGAGTEAWLCRGLSLLAALFPLALFANAKRGKNAVQNLVGIHSAGDAGKRL